MLILHVAACLGGRVASQAEAEAGALCTALSALASTQPAFLHSSGWLSRDDQSGPAPTVSIDMASVLSDSGDPAVETPSSHVTLGCVKLEIKVNSARLNGHKPHRYPKSLAERQRPRPHSWCSHRWREADPSTQQFGVLQGPRRRPGNGQARFLRFSFP